LVAARLGDRSTSNRLSTTTAAQIPTPPNARSPRDSSPCSNHVVYTAVPRTPSNPGSVSKHPGTVMCVAPTTGSASDVPAPSRSTAPTPISAPAAAATTASHPRANAASERSTSPPRNRNPHTPSRERACPARARVTSIRRLYPGLGARAIDRAGAIGIPEQFRTGPYRSTARVLGRVAVGSGSRLSSPPPPRPVLHCYASPACRFSHDLREAAGAGAAPHVPTRTVGLTPARPVRVIAGCRVSVSPLAQAGEGSVGR
jgi:hypothetical protein